MNETLTPLPVPEAEPAIQMPWPFHRVSGGRFSSTFALVVTLGAIVVSLTVCLLTYRWADLHASTDRIWLTMYGLPVALPILIAPVALRSSTRLMNALRVTNGRLAAEITRRMEAEERLEALANIDDLTQVANRRAFFARATELAAATGGAHAVAVMDVDYFKRLNDTQGHPAGDDALRRIGQLLGAGDPTVVAGRLGGEEFGLIMPETPITGATGICEELRHRIAQLPHDITASFGVTDWTVGSESIDQALARADAALYRAKQRGRNRTAVLPRSDEGGDRFMSDLQPLSRR